MSVKVTVEGVPEAIEYLKKSQKNAEEKIKISMSKSAIFIQGEVKSSIAGQRAEPTSVDTGRFLNSVDFKVGDEDAVIFTMVPYAKFLEWGTTRLNPRRHFNNSKDRNKEKIVQIFQAEINNI
jgi:HK97 gp10 family phage protein